MNVLHINQKIKQFLLLACICAIAVVLAGCGGGDSGAENAAKKEAESESFRPDTVQVDVVNVQSKDFVRTLNTTGTLSAKQKATVRAKVSGEITQVYVDIGDRVKKGEVLMKIDPTDYKLELQQVNAKLQQAEATLKDSKREKKRMQGLYKAGSATEQNRDKAVTAYEQAKAGYQQALAAKNDAEQKLDYTSIQAPFDGVITKRLYKKGDYAAAQPAAEVTDLSVLEAEMNVPEKYAGSINKGLPVTLSFQSQIDSVQGKVSAVNPQINTDNRTFLVKVRVNNSNRSLSDGLFFNATFNLPKLENQPAVPKEAIQSEEGQDILWVINNGKANRQPIQRGPQEGDWVMISQGINAGQTIAVGGTGSLIDGYPVTAQKVDSLAI